MKKSYGDVSIAVRDNVDMTVRDTWEYQCSSFETLGTQGAMRAFNLRGLNDEASIWDLAGDIVVREKRRKRAFRNAVIFYSSMVGLVDFMATMVAPEGPGFLSGFLLEARQRNGRINKSWLERQLENQPDDHRPRRYRRSEPMLPLPIAKLFRYTPYYPERGGRRATYYLAQSGGSDRWPVYGAAMAARIHGHDVPRMAYFTFTGDRQGHVVCERGESSLIFFDGEKHLFLDGWMDVDAAMAEVFDQAGTLYGSCDYDLFPPAHMKARCLVRVPGRKALGGHVKKRRPRQTPMSGRSGPPCGCDLLASPAYVFDSRRPIALTGDEPVLDDPACAAAVLSCLSRGIYIPNDNPRPLPEGGLPEKSSYLILAQPGGLS